MRYKEGITTPDESYWFGFLIGDGNLARDRNRITVVLQNRDYNHLLKLKAFFGEGYIRPSQESYTKYSIERKEQTKYLKNVGLRPAKTHIIDWNNIPYDYTVDFLRGLLDSDGTVYLKFPVTTIRWNGTQSLMNGIRDWIDVVCEFNTLPKVQEDRGSYNFGVSGRWKVQEMSEYLWNNPSTYLERKYAKVLELRRLNEIHPRQRRRLSRTDIERISDLSTNYKQTEIAKMFGVSNSLICRILKGERYAMGGVLRERS